MKVSALIPTYNRRHYVCRAIESVLGQTVSVDEIIVVDDGSTDGTADEIEHRYRGKVHVIRQANQGVSGARRRAVSAATGDWIAFLDSDDIWLPDRNEVMLKALEKLPSHVAWVFGNIQIITDDNCTATTYNEFGLSVTEAVTVFADPLIVQYPFLFGLLQASFIRKDALTEVDCFSENLKHSEDLLVAYQIGCRRGVAAVPNVVTKLYRTSNLSASSLMTDINVSDDYYHARMKAFALVAESGRRQPWGERYAEAVRGLCKHRSTKSLDIPFLALKQFRYGFSARSAVFLGAAAFGRLGLQIIGLIAKSLREIRGSCVASRPAVACNRTVTHRRAQ